MSVLPANPDSEGIVEDLLLGGRLRLLQPMRGHRAGTDALLLAAVAGGLASQAEAVIADLGSGVGTVGLAAALHAPHARVVLVERDAASAALGRRNIALNELEGRVEQAELDLFSSAARRAAGLDEAADLVLTNPPFHQADQVRRSPDAGRRAAHVLEGGTLDDWLRACAAVTRPGGRIVVVHRADVLSPLLEAMQRRFGGLAVKPVYPRAEAACVRLLVSGIKGSRAPLAILPPLVLHEADGRFTPESEAIHRGDSFLEL